MNKLQTVYIPIETTKEFWKKFDSGEIPDYEIISCSNGERLDEWVDSKEGYFFTPEELKQLLSEYTNRIVENGKCLHTGYGGYAINKKSITSQLPKFLK